ncbi:MAG TPA: hypothetical protein VMT58_09815, partial [Candidatus Binataceae bacterium]|nr:hypothetical protein [Candidatus Binataceae bacterium]
MGGWVGGYIFGFSPYILLEWGGGHPNLTLVILVPLALLVVARALAGELSGRKFVGELTAILAAQFLLFTEVFATMTLFGGVALLFGWTFARREQRSRLARVTVQIACAYATAAAALAPYLYWLFAYGYPQTPVWPLIQQAYTHSGLTFLPTGSVPLLAIMAAYTWSQWQTPSCKVLICTTVSVCLCLSSPRVHLLGALVPTP